jgi:hypothetical protein
MKQCSLSLTIKEIQIKTKLRFHFLALRKSTIKNTNDNKCCQGCGEKELHTLLLGFPLWKTVWRLLRKLNIDLKYDSARPPLGIYLKDCE